MKAREFIDKAGKWSAALFTSLGENAIGSLLALAAITLIALVAIFF